jgi:predicted PurR-regulated permease PerM
VRSSALTEIVVGLRPMSLPAVSASNAIADSPSVVGPSDSAVEPSLVTLPAQRMQIDARGLALGLLATFATVYTLSWAESFAVPLLLGIIISYTLNPLVDWLEVIKVPRVAGTGVVMITIMCALVFGTYSLRGQMRTIVTQLPEAAATISTEIARMRISATGNLGKMQAAANVMEQATTQDLGSPAATRQRTTHVIVDQPTFKLDNFLWKNSMGALGVIGQAMMVIILVFFMLIGSDTFKRKLVRITGPTLSKRKITVRILDDINRSIQKYMLMLLTTSAAVSLLTWIGFRWIGLENAGAWGVAAGVLHIIPYVGPGVTAVVTGMAAFVQFHSLAMALLVAGASLVIATVIGMFVTTWMTGRIAHLNPAAVFISLLFWSWLWGIWGALLSIPIIVIVKVVSQHVEQLHPMAEIVGD